MTGVDTIVVFRKWKGEVIALLPKELGDQDPDTCLSYMSKEGHGAADYDYIVHESMAAAPEDYADLKTELENLGYVLDVRTRAPRYSRNKRLYLLEELC